MSGGRPRAWAWDESARALRYAKDEAVQPGQAGAELPAGVVTFVMTDIEGSTRLFRELGEGYVGLLQTHNRLLRRAFEAHHGFEIDTEGDALVVVFADAADAILACVDGQRALESHPWPPGATVRVRMGVHTAQAVPTGDNYVSLGLHQAARICAGAHGGQVVVSETTASSVTGRLPSELTLQPLGSFQLRGFTSPARLFQVGRPDLPETFPPLRLHGVVHHNLPFTRSAFVDRDEERAALGRLINETGVVTIVGVGGVGKTRLAVRGAFDVMEEFDDGAWLVELAPVTDRPGMVGAVASVLDVAEVPGHSLESVVLDHLSARAALLVLDNCEQLLDAVADFAEQLARYSPHLVLVATSREPLGIEGEALLRLDPLPVSDPRKVRAASDVLADDSVRLFEERAALVRPGFRVTDDNAADVARIVSHLDGIPLAIELAAAAMSDRSVRGVLDGLADRFTLLTNGRRTAPRRHQTMRAALEWSLDLLGPDERLLFSRLAAFALTGTVDAASEVCGAAPLTRGAVPGLMRSLVHASLLSVGDDAGRWSMLSSVHELATLEMERRTETTELAARHRSWFARQVETVGPDLGLRGHGQNMAGVLADVANIRKSLASAAIAGDSDCALRIATGMTPFWMSHGDWAEGVGHLEAALALTGETGRLRGRALAALGSLLLLRGETDAAAERFAQATTVASTLGDELTLARSGSGLGYVAFRRSALDEAQMLWQEALAHAERAGDERVAAGILRSLAIADGSRGNQVVAGELLDRAIRAAEHARDDQLLRLLLGSRAEIHMWLAQYGDAQDQYGKALALAGTIGDLSARPLLLAELGWTALLTGEVTAVARLATEAVELAEDLGNRRVLVSALRLRGEGLMRQGRFTEASDDLDQALTVARELAAPAEVAGVTCSQACLALEQQRLTDAERLAQTTLELTTLPHSLRATFPHWVLGVVALTRGDLHTAEHMFRSGIIPFASSPRVDTDLERADAMPRHWANSLWGLARVRLAEGSIPDAAHLHRLALERRHIVGDRLGVVDSLVASAAVVAVSDPGTARDLVAAADGVRALLGAVATPRQAADVAAIQAASAARGDEQPGPVPVDEAAAVRLASHALGNLQRGLQAPHTQPRDMQAQAGTPGG